MAWSTPEVEDVEFIYTDEMSGSGLLASSP
jgi:hypothetical protein